MPRRWDGVGRVGRPLVIGPLVVLLALAVGAAYVRTRDDRIPLGDKGRVTATNDGSCADIDIEVDGLALRGSGWNEEDGLLVPREWAGRSIEGHLVLDRHRSEDGVEGTFTTDDGRVIPVHGGREGEYFFTLGCAIWGS